jgi:hypothetical protein
MFEYHSEFIQNREQRQLIEEAMLARETREPFYYDMLAGLGRQLTAWGERLQDRYDRACEMPVEMTPLERASK